MKTGIGLPVFPGVSIGPAVVYRKAERVLPVPSGALPSHFQEEGS